MGITIDNFFEKIYSVIFSPKDFFKGDDDVISVRLALGVVIFISALYKISTLIADGTIFKLSLIFFFFFYLITIVFLWFITGVFFEFIAKIFSKENRLNKILYYTAFAFVPYLFFAPFSLLKNIGITGYIFSVIIQLFLYFWIIILYAYAIRAAYKITLSRSFMIMLLPFISTFFSINWLVCFLEKICYIFSM